MGKSTLARRYADRRPLALVIDIDEIRTHLGQWTEIEESKVVARDLAIAMARDHLVRGHDVVVPQYLGRPEFRERLRALAEEVATPFVEILLTDAAGTVIARFTGRREEIARTGAAHPEGDLGDDSIASEVSRAIEDLRRDAVDRGVPIISAGDGLEAASDALLRCVAPHL